MNAPVDSAFLDLQQAVAGRYSLERELGRGGMGIVYLAHDVLLERPVAIKLLAPVLARRSDMRRRFLREARIAAQCFHPHIVPMHAVEEANELAFFVMGYVQGETLADRLRRTGPMTPEQVHRIGREIGWALAYAHERGVVHRDVKPENILLEDGSERALITDFGIALRDDPSATQHSGEVAGTGRYMAPEQALGESVDGRADLYALGVTLYLAATGQHPFDGRSTMARLLNADDTPAPPLLRLAPSLPFPLADAIERCLARRADDRVPSAAAFVRLLEEPPTRPPLPPSLLPVRASADAARGLLFWSGIIGATVVLLVAGEETQSLGRAFLIEVGASIFAVCGIAAAVRAGEALLQARRALRLGASDADVQRSLLSESAVDASPTRPLGGDRATWRHIGSIAIGGVLAFVQGQLTSLQGLPGAVDAIVQAALLVGPPVLMGRGVLELWRGSGAARWIRERVGTPIAAQVARLAGRGIAQRDQVRALPDAAPTELRLGLAADEIMARLSPTIREELRDVPAAAIALAREAERLRTRDEQLVATGRALRASPPADLEAALERNDAARARVQARLASTIAGLESIRLALLRLEVGDATSGDLTAQLEVVRHLQHRADAAEHVRQLLRERTPELTPV